MKRTLFFGSGWLALLLGLCLSGVFEAQAQMGGRMGGMGGFGGGGGFGGTRSGSRGSSSTRSYPPAGTIGDALISYDAETRRIVVIADEETQTAVSQVITNLDKPKPQVLIKVAFLEVTHNDGKDLGVEASYLHRFNPSTTGIVSTAFSGLAQPTSGGFYRLLSENYQVTLRALQEAGATEVLSRPSVLARNNQLATITVGEEIPLITNTRFDTLGGQINTISYTDIGIILRVTPFITSDDMVEMIVSPEISTRTVETVPIASTVDAPVIAKRSADTVVVTPDGVSVIIGGLMENKKTDSTQKVPILGDIPLLGWAFKRKTTTDKKTELIIVLTPHIVRTPGQLAELSAKEGQQSRLMGKVWPQDDLDRYIDSLPLKAGSSSVIRSTVPAKKKSSKEKAGKDTESRSKVN